MKKIVLITIVLLSIGKVKAECYGIILKISNGKLEKYDKNGNYKEIITNDASNADCNSSLVFVVKSNGKVEKYDFNSNYRGTI